MTRVTSTQTTLLNANVNGGVAVNMNATSITETQEVFTNIKAVPNGSTTPVWNTQLQSFRNTGFNNPTFTLNGIIDLRTDHATGASAFFDREYKNDFTMYAHTKCTLRDDLFITSTNLTGTITIVINNFTISKTNETNLGHFVTYTMSFTEVPQ